VGDRWDWQAILSSFLPSKDGQSNLAGKAQTRESREKTIAREMKSVISKCTHNNFNPFKIFRPSGEMSSSKRVMIVAHGDF
jgi:hypothetical protein